VSHQAVSLIATDQIDGISANILDQLHSGLQFFMARAPQVLWGIF
jgi:hypothetical protein